jgi:hypothetical protein
MYTIPMMFPLDSHGKIYVLQDEKGNTIGTGSRQVCKELLDILTQPYASSDSADPGISVSEEPSIRSAISIQRR